MTAKRILLASLLLFPFSLSATVISYDLDVEFSGAVEPISSGPWMTVAFDDGDTAGSVTMSINSSNLVNGEHIKNLYLNFSDDLDLDGLSFSYGTNNEYLGDTTWNKAYDSFKADGVGGYFDIFMDFTPSIAGGTFYEIDFTGTDILASSFALSSFDNNGDYDFHIASHIGSTGNDGEGSAWVTSGGGGSPPGCVDCPHDIPEPNVLLLVAIGLLGGVGAFRRHVH